MDWDGKSVPGRGAPLVSFDAPPAPPQDYQDWVSFLLETEGPSAELDSLGGQLHDLLLTGDIGRELEQVNGPLRVLIRIDPEDLAKLPWELMRKNGMLMFTDVMRPVARVAEHFNPALELPKMRWPLRVMLVVASADEQIHVEDEIRYVKDAFRKVCGLVDLEVCRLPSREGIRKLVEAMQPHVFHFIGHGGRDEEGGYLQLEQESGPDVQWTANAIRDDLAFVIRDSPDAVDQAFGVPRLVVLNACQSGQAEEHSGTLAAVEGLSRLNVPAVIAMQGPIRGDVAACFALGLYETLSAGGPLDRAVTRARVRITDKLPGSHRDYAVPQLILGARPEHILDLSQLDPGQGAKQPEPEVLSFVDRVPKRRKLWDGLRVERPAGPRIFTITGPLKSGKGSMVRWCLGVASALGYPTMFTEIKSGDYVDSVGFLDLLMEAAEGTPGFPDASQDLQVDLIRHENEQRLAAAEKRAYERSPLPLYQKLASVLAQVTAEQPLLIGIDGLTGVEPGAWVAHAVQGLVGPIARGQAGNLRLVVSLQENERDVRFPPQYFHPSRMMDIPIKLFPAADFVELISQRLRAQGWARDSFNAAVENHEQQWIRQQDWGTDHFDIFDRLAGQFELEPES